MKALWDLFSITAAGGTYYGVWQHDWLIILVCASPQFINFGYNISKLKNTE
jgi:hypothetical protein